MHLRGKIPLLGALGTLLFGGHGVEALTLDVTNTDSIKAAASNAAHGMVSFYHGNETGQIPGLLPGPYFWWEAGAMFGTLIEYWYLTGDDTYNSLVSQALLFQVGPNDDYMPPNQTKDLGNDDQAFWAFSAMTAAELKFPDPPSGQPSWLALAQAVFNLQANRWDYGACGGGLRWQIFPFNNGYDYKNTISTGGFFQLAARLARYTGNTTYADWAEKSWDWMYGSPLITKEWKIWDGTSRGNNCSDADQIYWTYNVGTLLAGATYMYNYTNGNATWGERVSGLMNGTNVFFVQTAGVNSPAKNGAPGGQIMAEVACEFPAAQTCNSDQPSFKAYLSRWMAMASIMAPFTSDVVIARLQASAVAAAGQCTGQPSGSVCGRRWYQTVWDGFSGVGEQMSALSVIQSNLVSKVPPPVTAVKGGTSVGNPSAGSGGDDSNTNANPVITKTISTGDKAGAGVLTAITLLLSIAELLGQGLGFIGGLLQGAHVSLLNIAQHDIGEGVRNRGIMEYKLRARAAIAGQLTIITSSNKKRKLSRPDLPDTQVDAILPRLITPTSPVHHLQNKSSSPGPPSPATAAQSTASPSPPRPIPQHLAQLRGVKGRSPTPEISSTAASSPSAAYAGLTLDSEQRGDNSGSESVGTHDSTRLSASRIILGSVSGLNRSSSPAKRTRTEMDGTSEPQHIEDIDMEDRRNSHHPPEHRSDDTEPLDLDVKDGVVPSQDGTKHRREVSGDMPPSEDILPLMPCQNITAMEDGSDTASSAAFLTPQSGISSSSPASASKTYISNESLEAQGNDIPSIDDQIKQVTELANEPIKEGQIGYIISRKWLSRVQSRGSDAQGRGESNKAALEGDVGPVDNTGINLVIDPTLGDLKDEAGDQFVPLKPSLQIGEDIEVFPQEAWTLVIKWYGLSESSPTITRYCHNTNTSDTAANFQYELYPPLFTILKLPDSSAGMTQQVMKDKQRLPVKILASRHEGFQKFLKRVKTKVGINIKTKVRVWKILGALGVKGQAGMLTPAQSRSTSPAPNVTVLLDPGTSLVLDVNSFAALQQGSQRELVETKDETMNEKYNGHSNLSFVGLSRDEIIVLEEQTGGPAGGEWVSDAVSDQAASKGVSISVTRNGSTAVQNGLKPKVTSSNRTASPVPGGMMTRGRAQKNGRTRGTTGLGNLGNTCYMNSALQCVRSVEELTHYFLQEEYKRELNPRNPLAYNGEVAKAYATLLRELYSDNSYSSFSPRHFKAIIGKYGPSFSGYGQQDSQEFLTFLLDGLQEDLNRVLKKPYIEKPDSTDEMVNNPVALREMADKCWEIYKARNDSVITDLFAGMYKSTVVCPVCTKVSIIFDPFNNLTLQLPVANVWSRIITFFPLYSRPIRVDVDMDKNASFLELKEYVARKVGVDAKKTVAAELYKHKFFKMFDDNGTISDQSITDGDIIAIYELEDTPTNYPPPKKKSQKQKSMLSSSSDDEEAVPEGDSPLADKMLVGVFNRLVKDKSSNFQQQGFFGVPFYIVVNREEAWNFEAILRKVLAKVATLTTENILQEEDGSDDGSAQHEDSDTVLMMTDDTDSSDSKVQAQSVQSEDGMVDISMQDASEASQATPYVSYPPQPRKLKRLPRMLQPGEYITPEVQTLFDMKYFSGDQMVPTGWNAIQDENGEYDSIASRIPQPVSPLAYTMQDEPKVFGQNTGSPISSDEDDHIQLVADTSVSRVQSDSDSDGTPEVAESANTDQGRYSTSSTKVRCKKSGLITYSGTGRRPVNIRGGGNTELDVEKVNGSLIRLGEAIILDWNIRNYDSLFDGSEATEDSMRGAPTWEQLPLLPDPGLDRKRQLRSARKHNGISLEDCLDEFGKAEILSESNAWFCPRCKEHRRASKKFELWKSPDILVIHLKRFSTQGRFRDKLDVLVDFPLEGLDLSSRVAIREDGKSPMYDLFAVDNHYGGLGGGHYTAFAKNVNGDWYEYNDSSVSMRKPQSVITPAAYLLFYRRRSPKILGGSFFEEKLQAVYGTPSTEAPSQSTSRTSSPAGEGKRLDGFSHNGSSSALQGVGAVHQVGGGGLADGMLTGPRTEKEDRDPPQYSQPLPEGEQTLETIESMELDSANRDNRQLRGHRLSEANGESWGFGRLLESANSHADTDDSDNGDIVHRLGSTKAPPGSEGDADEDLFDGASTKAVSSTGASVDGKQRLLTDFGESDWMPTPERFGSPAGGDECHHIGNSFGEGPPPIVIREPAAFNAGTNWAENDEGKGTSGYLSDMEGEGEVAEVRVGEGEIFKMD